MNLNMNVGDVVTYNVSLPDGSPLPWLQGVAYWSVVDVKVIGKTALQITAKAPGSVAVVVETWDGTHNAIVSRAIDVYVSGVPAQPPGLILTQN